MSVTSDFAFGSNSPGLDVYIQKSFPGVILNGTEVSGGWADVREVNGQLWSVINATWSSALSAYIQTVPTKASYAFVITSTGFLYLTASAGAPSPITWSATSTGASGLIFTTAVGLTAVGTNAGISNLSSPSGVLDPPLAPLGRDSFGNTFVGFGAGQNNTLGYYNTAIGYEALFNQVGSDGTGFSNTTVGLWSMYHNTSGAACTALGEQALFANTTGGNNTALGFAALQNTTTGSDNTAVGYTALENATTTAAQNTAIGSGAMTNAIVATQNTAVGYHALIWAGSTNANTAFGYEALSGINPGMTGNNNTGLGYGALQSITSGNGNVGIGQGVAPSASTAGSNTLVGTNSGSGLLTGNDNILIGASASAASLGQVTSGSQNVAIGYDVALASPTATGQIVISNFIYGGALTGTGATVSTAGWLALGQKTQLTTMTLTIVGGTGTTNGAFGDGAGVQTAGATGPSVGGIGVGTPGTAYNGFPLEWGVAGSTNIGAFIAAGAQVAGGVTASLFGAIIRGGGALHCFDTGGNAGFSGGVFPTKPTAAAPNTSPGFFTGTGAPSFNAMNGSQYMRLDGTHGGVTLLYLNTSGASTAGTSWTAIA